MDSKNTTHHNTGNTHATKPPELRRDERFSTRCTIAELEGYKALKAKFDGDRLTPNPNPIKAR